MKFLRRWIQYMAACALASIAELWTTSGGRSCVDSRPDDALPRAKALSAMNWAWSTSNSFLTCPLSAVFHKPKSIHSRRHCRLHFRFSAGVNETWATASWNDKLTIWQNPLAGIRVACRSTLGCRCLPKVLWSLLRTDYRMWLRFRNPLLVQAPLFPENRSVFIERTKYTPSNMAG